MAYQSQESDCRIYSRTPYVQHKTPSAHRNTPSRCLLSTLRTSVADTLCVHLGTRTPMTTVHTCLSLPQQEADRMVPRTVVQMSPISPRCEARSARCRSLARGSAVFLIPLSSGLPIKSTTRQPPWLWCAPHRWRCSLISARGNVYENSCEVLPKWLWGRGGAALCSSHIVRRPFGLFSWARDDAVDMLHSAVRPEAFRLGFGLGATISKRTVCAVRMGGQ